MKKELPQHTPERFAELISKHLIPALQKQPKTQKIEETPNRLKEQKDEKRNKSSK